MIQSRWDLPDLAPAVVAEKLFGFGVSDYFGSSLKK